MTSELRRECLSVFRTCCSELSEDKFVSTLLRSPSLASTPCCSPCCWWSCEQIRKRRNGSIVEILETWLEILFQQSAVAAVAGVAAGVADDGGGGDGGCVVLARSARRRQKFPARCSRCGRSCVCCRCRCCWSSSHRRPELIRSCLSSSTVRRR